MPSLSGKTIVFTGMLTSMTRNEAVAFAINANANVSSNISRNTDYVVAGPGAGSKLNKAYIFGVKVLTEADFIRMAASDQQARKASRRIVPAPKPSLTPYMDIIPELDID